MPGDGLRSPVGGACPAHGQEQGEDGVTVGREWGWGRQGWEMRARGCKDLALLWLPEGRRKASEF